MKLPLARSLVLLALACTSSANLSAQTAAIAAANQSKTLAVAAEGAQSPFVKQNDDLIASLK